MFSPGYYSDDFFDVILIEFGDFIEEFFFLALCHILFKIGEFGEEFIFFLFGEGELAETF